MIDLKRRPVFRICLLAMCLALYTVLNIFSIETPLGLKITFDGLPLLFISIVAGPVDGMIVGGLGTFLKDLIKPMIVPTAYGLSITTPLWMIPAIVRALIVGLVFRKKDVNENPYVWFIVGTLTALLTTALNTVIWILDGIIFGYSPAFTYLMIVLRIVFGLITSLIYIFMIPKIVLAVKKSNSKSFKKDSD